MAQNINVKLCEGLLHKRGKLNKGWKERYFVLTDDLKLKYYESQSNQAQDEMNGNDKNVCGVIDILNVELIEIALINDNSIDENSIKYVKILKNYKKTSANSNGKNNESGAIDNVRCNIIHLILSSRTYILSANTTKDFNKWLSLFYKYIYGGIIFESFGFKQGLKNKSFKRRYFVLNEYKQIKYFNNDQREQMHGFIDLNDIHSFNTESIENPQAPNDNLLQLNGSKRIWIICFDTNEILTKWCQLFEKNLNLKCARKVGDSFFKQDTTYFPMHDDDEEDTKENEHATEEFRDVRGGTMTQNMDKQNGFQISIDKPTPMDDDNEGYMIETTATITDGMDDEDMNEYNIQYEINVDAIGLYQDENLENEMFGIDGFEKGDLKNGKTITDKVIQFANGLYASNMAVKEMGIISITPTGYLDTSNNNTTQGGDQPDYTKIPSYFNI